MFNVVGFLGKLGIVMIVFVNVMINFVFVFVFNLWIVILNFDGVFNNVWSFENEYCVFVIYIG